MSDRHAFEVGANPALDIRADSGSIDVRTGPPGTITVTIGDRPDDWDVRLVGDTVVVSPVSRWRSRSARLAAEVPEGAQIEIRTASARCRVDGAFGDVSAWTASGDITIGSATTLSITTASGDARVGDVVGDAEIKSVSGDVEVTSIGGRMSVTTTSGDIRSGPIGGDVAVKTTSGDARLARVDGAAVAVQSVSGDITIGLPSGIRVDPDLATFSGKTRLPRPRPESSAPSEVPRRLVRVAVKTVSGDITIERAD